MDSKIERSGENISVPQSSVVRPRDLRSSKKKNGSSFSRVSAARASLGATSYAWMEAADRLESEEADSTTTWPRLKKISLISNEDLDLEYDASLLKRTKLVPCKGPFDLEQSGFLFQGVFDRDLKRYWGLRITLSNSSVQNQVPFHTDEVIVGVNEEKFKCKSRDELLAILIDGLSKPQVSVISVLKQQDFAVPFLSQSPVLNNEAANRPSSRSTVSPVSYIKNLNAFNTRSIGQLITVALHKLSDGGFGISFATRDTLVNSDGMEPIFVERIMPNGAAIHDGRVQFGDRLLSVNGVQVTTFKDAMNALRSIPVGEKATLVFSRQEAVVATTPSLTTSPVDLSTDPSSRRASNTNLDLAFEPPLCKKIVIRIPVPHPNSGSSSLGIRFEAWSEPRIIHAFAEYTGSDLDDDSMVGDTESLEEDLSGLFVKHIASDSPTSSGHLRPGDRLIAINGHSIVGASPEEIAAKLKSSLQKAQEKMVRRNKQVFLKLTVNRFFHRNEKHSLVPGTKSILRPAIDVTLDKIMTTNKNVKVRIDKDEDDENPEIPPRRMARTPSLDSRGRLRRDRESRSSSNSPVRCQSAFTRDGVGRRSVSEKRHAHMNAADFPILNKNAFVHRSIADEQARLYETMPTSRKIRQIRHSKQGRTSGPVKPVHNEEPPKAPNAKKSSAPSKDGVTLLEKARKREDGVLRTDPINELGTSANQVPTQGLSRSRSQNHSFRAALSNPTSSKEPQPPESNPKSPPDNTNPPIPPRRLKLTPPTSDLQKGKAFPSPSPPSVNSNSSSATAASQHKAFEDFMQTRRCDNNTSNCLLMSRRGSSGSNDEEDNPCNFLTPSSPPRVTSKPVVLTDVRPIVSDLRRTPSPVDFNAYAAEQNESRKFSQPSKSKPTSNFLEEVETCLPKRRPPPCPHDTRQREDPVCTTSDPSATLSRRNMVDSLPCDGYTTFPKMVQQRNGVAGIPLVHKPCPVEQIGYRYEDYTNRLPIPHTSAQSHVMKSKMNSPHAIVRSHSPATTYRNKDYSRSVSSTYPSDRQRRPSYSLTRTSKTSNSLQPRASLNNNQVVKPQVRNYEPCQIYFHLLPPITPPKGNLNTIAHDNRSRRRNIQSELPFQPIPSLNVRQPESHASSVIIRPKLRSVSQFRPQSSILTPTNDREFPNHFFL